MHNNIPKLFQFIESFETNLIKNRTKNLGIIYRNYSNKINETSLIKYKKFCKKNNIKLYLANNIKINRKIEQGCEIIFLAPLFKTKKSKNHLNISKFNILTLNKKVKFVALGGIKKNNISKTKMLNICGISGISMFQKKTGL